MTIYLYALVVCCFTHLLEGLDYKKSILIACITNTMVQFTSLV